MSRKTSRGVPRYEAEQPDTFVLSGAEDLVPVAIAQGRVGYRPRTEGLFARIEHVHDRSDHWEVRSRDRLVTRYGHAANAGAGLNWRDPAVVGEPGRVFAWGSPRPPTCSATSSATPTGATAATTGAAPGAPPARTAQASVPAQGGTP